MSSTSTAPHDISKLPLAFAFGAAIVALVAVTGAKLAGVSPVQSLGATQVLESRLLRFETQTDGTVRVVDASTGATISDAGKEGFIPGVLRGLDRLRRIGQASPAQAYRLERLDNGQLVLVDTASGVTLDLNAYGHSNAMVFDKFLAKTGDKS